MALSRLVYCSSSDSEDFDTGTLLEILKTSRTNNHLRNISGVLMYDNFRFLQCLEGEKDTIQALYETIKNDPRHYDVAVLDMRETEKRLFEKWTMGFIGGIETNQKLKETFYPESDFDPMSMGFDRCMTMLESFASQSSDL